MDRAKRLPKIGDAERESMFGYVYAVSGPGEALYFVTCHLCVLFHILNGVPAERECCLIASYVIKMHAAFVLRSYNVNYVSEYVEIV